MVMSSAHNSQMTMLSREQEAQECDATMLKKVTSDG